MLKHIGKTSGSKSQQKESDPDKERMRCELIASFRHEKIGRKIKKHIDEISEEGALWESISYLLDSTGQMPPNAPLESVIKQERKLRAQIRWLEAWSGVFEKMLRRLDEPRFERERAERELDEENARRERRKNKGLNQIGGEDTGRGKLLKALDEAIQSEYRAMNLLKYLDSDDSDARVFAIRRIESGVRLVFSEFMNRKDIQNRSVAEQYQLIRDQLTWIDMIAADVRAKLTKVIEIGEAASEMPEPPGDSDDR